MSANVVSLTRHEARTVFLALEAAAEFAIQHAPGDRALAVEFELDGAIRILGRKLLPDLYDDDPDT